LFNLAIIPSTFDEWRHCIEKECEITLTERFINERLDALGNIENQHTKHFLKCYGQTHYKSVMKWLLQAKSMYK
jgi:hypothetical protein